VAGAGQASSFKFLVTILKTFATQMFGDKGKCRRMDALPHSQKRQQQWQQSKDLAFAAAASTDDCSNCCCIQRMTVSGVQKARTICNLTS
jgi:hypothetical protein